MGLGAFSVFITFFTDYPPKFAIPVCAFVGIKLLDNTFNLWLRCADFGERLLRKIWSY
jgi:hypothetical protein